MNSVDLPHKVAYDKEAMFNSFEPFSVPAVGPNGEKYLKTQQTKTREQPMYNQTTVNANAEDLRTAKRIRFLRDTAADAFFDKKTALKRKFFITVDAPTTMAEALERIASGKYTFDLEKNGDRPFWGSFDRIEWRTPDMKEDKAGYAEARKALDAEYQLLREDIEILDPAEALKKVREFRAAA